MPNPKQIFTGVDDDILDHVNISPDEILKTLSVLKPEKAPGVDWIFPVVLKEVASMISLPLSWIFVRRLTGGVVPEDWHKANVSALYKKGPKNLAENYRPVSLTSQICKVMESLIRDAIVEHLKKHSLIIDSQHGFRQGRSCLTNLLKFLEELSSYIVLPHLCCDAIPQQDFNPMLFPISIQV